MSQPLPLGEASPEASPATKNTTGFGRPQLSFWHIWNMCFGFLGIQFGFALQNANVSRIFQTLGAGIDDIPILWIAGPVTGLLVQPLVGYLSDRTWNRLGRRRPFFTLGAFAAAIALVFMPNSPTLWIAAGMLWVMDASFNIAMEPFRAFVGDMLPERQRARGFAMQSFFIGVGSVVASALPWILTNWLGVDNTAAAGEIPFTVTLAFYFGGAVLFISVMWSVISTREYSPAQLEAYHRAEGQVTEAVTSKGTSKKDYLLKGLLCLGSSLLFAATILTAELKKELYILSGLLFLFAALLISAGLLNARNRTDNAIYQITHDLFHMPGTMVRLAVVQFFSWFALFALWIYATPAVTAHHFHSSDTASAAYNNGADWVGILFAAYNAFAALAAFAIPIMARYLGQKWTHFSNLMLGAAGFVSFLVFDDPDWLILSMVGVGFAWASILSMPYAMLSCVLPGNKMGVYMGIFNFFIVIPQILASSLLGLAIDGLFDGEAIYALPLGGVCFVLAGIATLRLKHT